MTGWNLPPGCNVNDLPGNSKEEQEAEALYDKLYEEISKIITTSVDDEPQLNNLIEYVYKQIGEAYHLGYAQGMADEAEANSEQRNSNHDHETKELLQQPVASRVDPRTADQHVGGGGDQGGDQ